MLFLNVSSLSISCTATGCGKMQFCSHRRVNETFCILRLCSTMDFMSHLVTTEVDAQVRLTVSSARSADLRGSPRCLAGWAGKTGSQWANTEVRWSLHFSSSETFRSAAVSSPLSTSFFFQMWWYARDEAWDLFFSLIFSVRRKTPPKQTSDTPKDFLGTKLYKKDGITCCFSCYKGKYQPHSAA